MIAEGYTTTPTCTCGITYTDGSLPPLCKIHDRYAPAAPEDTKPMSENEWKKTGPGIYAIPNTNGAEYDRGFRAGVEAMMILVGRK